MNYLEELDKRMRDADTPGTTPGNCGIKILRINVNGSTKTAIYIPEVQAVYFFTGMKNKKPTYNFVKNVKTFSEAKTQAINYYLFTSTKPQEKKMKWETSKLEWTRRPKNFFISDDKIEIVTEPHTDLWQRTYYHFHNDNAPVLQIATEEKYFSFTVKTDFAESHHRFDQCGVALYLDSENWLKGSIEYENEKFQHLGSVVTNRGYSDWATTEIPANTKSMWYRLSRREDDFCIECSDDGNVFHQMRVCHLHEAKGKVQFGIYACSPEDSSFKAVFTNMEITECKWLAHDGQQPDEE